MKRHDRYLGERVSLMTCGRTEEGPSRMSKKKAQLRAGLGGGGICDRGGSDPMAKKCETLRKIAQLGEIAGNCAKL